MDPKVRRARFIFARRILFSRPQNLFANVRRPPGASKYNPRKRLNPHFRPKYFLTLPGSRK
jgi:hypothetical protein